MRRTHALAVLTATMLLATPQLSFADHRGGGGHYGGGAPWWWIIPPLVYLATLPAYYPDPQPVIIQQPQPQVIMQPPMPAAYPQAAMPPALQSWYFCASANGYYPYVANCPEGWRQVPAIPPGMLR